MKNRILTISAVTLTFTLVLAFGVGFAAANVGTSDDFTGSSINGVWTQYGTGTFSLTGGTWLTISAPGPASDLWSPTLTAPRLMQSGIDQDFVVTTKISGTFDGANGVPQRAGILVWADQNNFFRAERKEQTQVHTVVSQSGVMQDGVYQSLPSDINPTYLKVTLQTSTLTAAWSQDGVSWNTFATVNGFTVSYPIQVGLFVIADNAGAFSANFDYFNISPAGMVATPESPLGALAIPLAVAGAFVVFARKPKLKIKA